MKNIFILFLLDLIKMRGVIYELTKRDFQQQYKGSYLGFVWMFLQPLLFIVVLYVILSLGFRTGANDAMPFSLYLVSGMVPWLYIASSFSSGSDAIRSHSFLVNKVDFRLSILPIVKILSGLPAHIFLLVLIVLLAWKQGYPPGFHTILLVYYMLSMGALLFGLTLLTASTSLFVRDVSKVVTVVIQFGFWLTPIFWNINMVPDKYHWLIKLNPVFYIASGYRESIVGNSAVYLHYADAIYYWGLTIFIMLIGIKVYRSLKPHFAEVT